MPEPKAKASCAQLYVAAHRIRSAAAVMLGLSLVVVLLGGILVPLPNAAGAMGVPFRRFLPLAFAVTAVGSLASPFAAFEEASTSSLPRFERFHTVLATGVACTCVAVAEMLGGHDVGHSISALRSVLVWTGLALLSSRLFGRSLVWILPAASIVPLVYFGLDANGLPTRLNWTALPAGDITAWWLAALSVSTGTIGVAMTAWRIRGLSPRAGKAQPNPTSTHLH